MDEYMKKYPTPEEYNKMITVSEQEIIEEATDREYTRVLNIVDERIAKAEQEEFHNGHTKLVVLDILKTLRLEIVGKQD